MPFCKLTKVSSSITERVLIQETCDYFEESPPDSTEEAGGGSSIGGAGFDDDDTGNNPGTNVVPVGAQDRELLGLEEKEEDLSTTNTVYREVDLNFGGGGGGGSLS